MARQPLLSREDVAVKRIFLLCTFFVSAQLSFAARAGGTSQSTSEVYAIASDGTPLSWTVYAPPGEGPWPAVLVIHGGFFSGGDPEDAGVTGCAQDLANAGFIAFAIDYRLAPPAPSRARPRRADFPSNTMMCIWPCGRPAMMPAATDRWGLSAALLVERMPPGWLQQAR